MSEPMTDAELEDAERLCFGWPGRFAFREACEHDRGIGRVADCVDYDEALVYVPEEADDEHDHDVCLTIADGLDTGVLKSLADLCNLPASLLAEVRRLRAIGPQLSEAVARFVAAEAEVDRLRAILAIHVDHTNPQCPIGAALTGDSK